MDGHKPMSEEAKKSLESDRPMQACHRGRNVTNSVQGQRQDNSFLFIFPISTVSEDIGLLEAEKSKQRWCGVMSCRVVSCSQKLDQQG